MYGWIGKIAVLAALAFACTGSIVAFGAGKKRHLRAGAWAILLSYGFALSMLVANGSMICALLKHDFSVGYVAQVGSLSTPNLISVVSLWSSLEGSILFWGLILGLYTAAFAFGQRHRPPHMVGYSLGVILAVAAFFAFLIAAPADPFAIVSPVPTDGPGPNPLLQNHPLMIIHPPMLYLGYVGMTIPFGIALACLLAGTINNGWLRLLRHWTLIPWAFLSVGIILGSWWAYEVLGWGGYWAWDPVENASFLPWLVATAYLHSTVVQERRQLFKAWTLTLILAAFMLTILGTFMTRSGVFNSVHSFTQSPIGPVFLVFLGIVLCVCLLLLAGRAHLLQDEGSLRAVWSRETAFLLNNVVFVVFTFTVLLGTIFPLLTEAFKGEKISVGEPYFDKMALPIGLMLVFLMGVGPVLPWGVARKSVLLRTWIFPVCLGALVAAICAVCGWSNPWVLFCFALCGFAACVTVTELALPGWQRAQRRGERIDVALWQSWRNNPRRTGGYIVHLGVLVIVAAIAGSQAYKQNKEASLAVGDTVSIGTYTLTYLGAEGLQEANRFAVVAHVKVARAQQELGQMLPRLNFYPSQREPIGTPHVVTFGSTDLYVSLLSVESDGSRIALKIFLIPMVPWLWRSLPLFVLGSMLSLWPRRRKNAPTTNPVHTTSSTALEPR